MLSDRSEGVLRLMQSQSPQRRIDGYPCIETQEERTKPLRSILIEDSKEGKDKDIGCNGDREKANGNHQMK